MSPTCPCLVIAGTQSGVGKTSLAVGLARALTRKGLRAQTFKVGPDFLDPTYLAIASGRPCYNLDGWMCGRDYVLDLFARKSADADVALVEGVMGLFDGASPETSEGSTAEIARWLQAPVILTANAKGAARSFAAMVKGFHTFEPGVSIAGVIANQCGSQRHVEWLAQALNSACLPSLLGSVPHGAIPALPSRHLGLVTADKTTLDLSTLDALADALEKHLHIEAIIKIAKSAPPRSADWQSAVSPVANRLPVIRPHHQSFAITPLIPSVTIGLAHDNAFHFYYPDNIEALAAAGARIVPFSPLTDPLLPAKLDAIYFGGGYPEVYAAQLSANTAMRQAVRHFADSGGAIYAECGGLMYLSQGIETLDGQRHPMAGLLPTWTRMRSSRKMLGYVEAQLAADSLLGSKGARLRGHEFHYSELIEPSEPRHDWQPAYELSYRRQGASIAEGFLRGRILASYVHLHFGSNLKAAESFIQFAAQRKHP